MASMPAQPAPVTVGVDTHADSHVAAVVDQTGRVLGSASFAASTRGYVALVNWAERLGPVAKVGIEGTGTYGAGLARFVRAYGLEVVEVDRPDRRTRRCLASPIRSTPRRPLEPPCLGWPPPPPRPVRDTSR
jgi:Transposase